MQPNCFSGSYEQHGDLFVIIFRVVNLLNKACFCGFFVQLLAVCIVPRPKISRKNRNWSVNAIVMSIWKALLKVMSHLWKVLEGLLMLPSSLSEKSASASACLGYQILISLHIFISMHTHEMLSY
ncbi:hypothetical protein HS088_TW23G00443 [Tripterygium wilfordii]|uniref:Uncharacterized protein n=1 Tax=Tripterygium wilfordii TaxID=458696 RepID=A0A7J7BVY8_TRIWF|nr:hypothetical protein HS088_TW23G00443 [Tripterygium wilfordii]